MNLVLQREVLSDKSTIGKLSVDDEYMCATLEDVVRGDGVKVHAKTAIPVGRYRVLITDSRRFLKPMPLLVGVPGFEGIRIHSGNTSEDTEGCLLVGLTKGPNFVGKSREAMERLMPLLEAALQDGQEVWIDIRNP